MQFKVVRDSGTAISARMVITGVGPSPSILVSAPDLDEVEVRARYQKKIEGKNGKQQKFFAAFRVDQKTFPKLDSAKAIEIRDAKTRALLFRRFQPEQYLKRKLFLFNLQAMPETTLESELNKHFAIPHCAVERFPPDVLLDLIGNRSTISAYMMGRPGLPRCLEPLKKNGFTTVALLRDPYEELAEKLLFLRLTLKNHSMRNFSDYLTDLQPLMRLAKTFAGGDGLSSEAFKALPKARRQAVANPLIRALACDLGEMPGEHHIPIALDNLSQMDLVGLRTRFQDFRLSLLEDLGLDIIVDYQPTADSVVAAAAAELQGVPDVRDLIGLDLELYAHAKEAIERALGPA